MNLYKLVLLACIFIFSQVQVSAQEYLEFLESEILTFQEKVDKAEAHFDEKGRGKHTGYKLFLRWKYFAERNLDINGYIITEKQTADNFDKYLDKQGVNKTMAAPWEELGPVSATNTSTWSSHIGRITNIAIDPNDDNHIIITSPGGGVWKTTDEGTNWTPLYEDQSSMSVSSAIISYADSDLYLVGASNGLKRSTNGGATWNNTSGAGGTMLAIIQHPTISSIFLGVSSNDRVYRSIDGGQNWTSSLNHGSDLVDIEFKPGDPNTVYCSGRNGGMYISTNNGQTWSVLSGPWNSSRTIMFATTPDDPNYLYVLQEKSGGFGALYLSTDGGSTFNTQSHDNNNDNNIMGYNLTENGGQAPRDMDIIVSPTDKTEVHVAGIMTFKSVDSGVNWTQTTHWVLSNSLPFVHADIDQLIYSGSKIYVASDGGIFISYDGGNSFVDKTTGLGLRQFYRLSASKTDAERVAGGSQDNGTGVLRDGVWYDFVGADGMEPLILPEDENIVIGSIQFGGLYKSEDGGNSLGSISQTQSGQNGDWVTPLEPDGAHSKTFYQAKRHLYKTINGGTSWTTISDITPPGNATADELRIAPSNSNVIYLLYNPYLYKTIDGGANWTVITPSTGLFNNIYYIDVDPQDENHVIMAVNGESKVLESTNGGTSWSSITFDLPNLSANCVLFDNTPNNGIFVGMNRGVYFKDNSSPSSWSLVGSGLPNVSVRELEIVNNRLYAATYGRGLWATDVSATGCSLFANAAINECLSNGTVDSLDDQYSIILDPVGLNLGTTYSVSGDFTFNNQSYGSPLIIDNNGSYFNLIDTPIKLTITDDSNAGCNTSFTFYPSTISCYGNFTCFESLEIYGEGTYTALGPSEGNGANNGGASHANWFSFTPQKDGIFSVYSCGGGEDTRVHLYSGSCGSLSLIESDDDSCEMTPGSPLYASQIENIAMSAGTSYYIEWDDKWSGSAFDFYITYQEECLDYLVADVTNYGFTDLKASDQILIKGTMSSSINAYSNDVKPQNLLNVVSGGSFNIKEVDCDKNDFYDWMVMSQKDISLTDDGVTIIELEVPSEVTNLINDLHIQLNIDHPNLAELDIELITPNNDNVVLWNNYCQNGSTLNCLISESGSISNVCSDDYTKGRKIYSPGEVPSSSIINLVQGLSSSGTWQLKITDNKNGNSGIVNQAGIYFK